MSHASAATVHRWILWVVVLVAAAGWGVAVSAQVDTGSVDVEVGVVNTRPLPGEQTVEQYLDQLRAAAATSTTTEVP